MRGHRRHRLPGAVMGYPTRHLLSPDNGTQPVPRITLDESNQPHCPADYPHLRHTDAVWYDWQSVEVWTCEGLAFAPLEDEVSR